MKKIKLPKDTKWIWTEDVHENQFVATKKVIKLDKIKATSINIFADTKYKLYVNGRFVNSGPAPFRKPFVQVDKLDITHFLKKGNNIIFIVGYFVGCNTKYNTVDKPGMIAWIKSSSNILDKTDESWKVGELTCWEKDAARKNWAIEAIENVDMCEPTFDVLVKYATEDYFVEKAKMPSKFWKTPNCYDYDSIEFVERFAPLLKWKREDVLLPTEISRGNTEVYLLQDMAGRLEHEHAWKELEEAAFEMTRGGTAKFDRRIGEPGFLLLYDMKRECAGEVAVEIEVDSDCTLDIGLAEARRKDGRPVVSRGGNSYVARFKLKKGLNKLRWYHFNGHRYVYLSIKDVIGKTEVKSCTTHHCRADLDYKDSLACSIRLSESLYRICARAIRINTQAYAYDCNTREQGAYWGDGIWIVDSVGHMTGDFSHMKDMAYAMTTEYNAVGVIPASLYGLGAPLYDYSVVPVELLKRYFLYTGDLKTVEDNIETARKIVEDFRGAKDKEGFINVTKFVEDDDNEFRKGFVFLDHPGNGWHPMTTVGIDRRKPDVGMTLFYLQALQALAVLEKAVGKTTKKLDKEIKELQKLIQDRAFDETTGLIKDAAVKDSGFSQIVNAMAITTNVIDGQKAEFAYKSILEAGRKYTYISQGTPYSTFYLADAGVKLNMIAEPFESFNNDFFFMLKRGATTTWEGWSAENHDSLCHAWSSPLPHLVSRGAMGLLALKPGYSEFQLKPAFETFDCFEGTCCIPQGKITMSWKRESVSGFSLQIKIPSGTVCKVLLNGEVKTITKSIKCKIVI